jgi:hypothetical protein
MNPHAVRLAGDDEDVTSMHCLSSLPGIEGHSIAPTKSPLPPFSKGGKFQARELVFPL